MAGSKLYLNVRNIISSTVCTAFSTYGHCVFFQSHPIWKPMFSSGVDVYLRSWPCAVDRAICGAQAARLDIWGSMVQYFWRPLKKERYISVRTALWGPTWQRFNLTGSHSSPIASKLRQVWLMRCFVAFLHAPSRSLWTSLGRILFDWTAIFTAHPFVTGSAKNGFDNGWLFMAYRNVYGNGYGNCY